MRNQWTGVVCSNPPTRWTPARANPRGANVRNPVCVRAPAPTTCSHLSKNTHLWMITPLVTGEGARAANGSLLSVPVSAAFRTAPYAALLLQKDLHQYLLLLTERCPKRTFAFVEKAKSKNSIRRVFRSRPVQRQRGTSHPAPSPAPLGTTLRISAPSRQSCELSTSMCALSRFISCICLQDGF